MTSESWSGILPVRANELRQDLWRAGHAHAGVLLILSLVILRYVDETNLLPTTKRFVRLAAPTAAILLPVAYLLSILSPDATEPNRLSERRKASKKGV
jgi:hypothetical protein